MIISDNDQLLFTAGADGTLMIYDLNESKQQIQEKEETLNIWIAEDWLIKRADYNEKLKKLNNLDKQINDLKITNRIMIEMKRKQTME